MCVAFGNAADETLVWPLPVLASYPSASDLRQPNFSWTPGASQWVKFALPRGLGANRSVRVVPYFTGSAVSLQSIFAVPTLGGPADTFSFDPPAVSFVVVLPVTLAQDAAAVASLFPTMMDLSTARRIEVFGHSFGPPASLTGDAVQRLIDFQSPETYLPSAQWSSTTVLVANWSSSLVVGYTLATSGVVRLRVVAAAPVGAVPATQVRCGYQYV